MQQGDDVMLVQSILLEAGGDFTELQQTLFDQDGPGEIVVRPKLPCILGKQHIPTNLRECAAISLTS